MYAAQRASVPDVGSRFMIGDSRFLVRLSRPDEFDGPELYFGRHGASS